MTPETSKLHLNKPEAEKTKNSSDTYRVESAILKGKKNLQEEQEIDSNKFTINLSKKDNQKLRELTSAFRLKTEIMIESSLNYIHFFLTKQRSEMVHVIDIDQDENIAGDSETSKLHEYNLTLSLDAIDKVKRLTNENEIDLKINDYAVLGIRLLHKNNCSFIKAMN